MILPSKVEVIVPEEETNASEFMQLAFPLGEFVMTMTTNIVT